MFFKLIKRNSKRNRKENGLFFASLLISIIAFYIILSLSTQDVMIFLAKMESDAVNRLLTLIPVFYGITLFILFFLIYYASKFQLLRRSHEFGVYLMMGMRRLKLFALLLLEDLSSSFIALLIGLPVAILLSELISLITARFIGLGIIGHQITFSARAVLLTAAGFLFIKLAAFLILSGRIARQEIASLLVDAPEGTKRQFKKPVYASSLIIGILCLAAAYTMAIKGISWYRPDLMLLTVALGFLGTLLLFFGLRFFIELLTKYGNKDRCLHVFNFRQLQENVIHRSATLAVSSLLILAALCCFGAGVAIAHFYGNSEQHILDYTFTDPSGELLDTASVKNTLAAHGLDTRFSDLFEMKIGYALPPEDSEGAAGSEDTEPSEDSEGIPRVFYMDSVMSAISDLEPSEDRDILLNNLSYTETPHLIALSGYNRLLAAAGLPEITLEKNEAFVYQDSEFTTPARIGILNQVLKDRPKTSLNDNPCYLTGTVQTASLVTDRSISLSFALIVPDKVFDEYTRGDYEIYLNGILDPELTEDTSLMRVILDMNGELSATGLSYESYLQNMGRQLFYVVAASYITIYLAIIFLIISNTVIGVQFLMGQQKSHRRYRTLIHLGATYKILCQSAEKQIKWYFGIPTAIAAVSSLFGVRALFSGLLSSRTQSNLPEMMMVSAAMIFVLCVIEYIYMTVVIRSSNKYLLTLMIPERDE